MSDRKVKSRFVPAYYIEQLFRFKSSEEFFKYRLFPNLKEWCESYACYEAIKRIVSWDKKIDLRDSNIRVIVVGDGQVPRTGALLAFLTNWSVISVDPIMKNRDYSAIQRLQVISAGIEHLKFGCNIGSIHTTIIIHPHSHAKTADSWEAANCDRKYLINMPCCVKSNLDLPYISYTDKYIPSPKNRIEIYSNCSEITLIPSP